METAALIVSDLDLFKSINDRHGHAAGDRIIQSFAKLLQRGTPRDALIARLGGEEFAVLLPSCDLSTAHRIAENLRTTFKASAPDVVHGTQHPTASFGIAIGTGHEELGALLDQADRALYQAKQEGRDCVRSLGQNFGDRWLTAL